MKLQVVGWLATSLIEAPAKASEQCSIIVVTSRRRSRVSTANKFLTHLTNSSIIFIFHFEHKTAFCKKLMIILIIKKLL